MCIYERSADQKKKKKRKTFRKSEDNFIFKRYIDTFHLYWIYIFYLMFCSTKKLISDSILIHISHTRTRESLWISFFFFFVSFLIRCTRVHEVLYWFANGRISHHCQNHTKRCYGRCMNIDCVCVYMYVRKSGKEFLELDMQTFDV